MSNTVYTTETITLQDDNEVTLRPISIKLQREFMKHFKKMQEGEVKSEEDGLEVFIDMAGVCLRRQLADKFEGRDITKGPAAKEYKEYLEDVLDMDTIFRILDVCGGIKLGDPNLTALTQNREQDGSTST